MQCDKCHKEVLLPFKCPYCEGYFCPEHRLPENHECPQIELARSPIQVKSTTIKRQEPYEYSVSYVSVAPPKSGRVHFSMKEIQHLAIASLLVIGIAISWVVTLGFRIGVVDPIIAVALAATLTASFFAHEMAHKITAQKHGFWAEFRLTFMGAILTLISMISPYFKIISPGAVFISGLADRKSLGKVSIAGPTTNIALSIMFLSASNFSVQSILAWVFLLGAALNAWIALFNLIPLGMLDGFKVFSWGKKVWILAFAISLVLTVYTYMLIF